MSVLFVLRLFLTIVASSQPPSRASVNIGHSGGTAPQVSAIGPLDSCQRTWREPRKRSTDLPIAALLACCQVRVVPCSERKTSAIILRSEVRPCDYFSPPSIPAGDPGESTPGSCRAKPTADHELVALLIGQSASRHTRRNYERQPPASGFIGRPFGIRPPRRRASPSRQPRRRGIGHEGERNCRSSEAR